MILRAVILTFVATASLLAADGDAALQVITLKDNSVIRAHVTEVAGGFYLANSPTLGNLKIPTGEVVAIKNEELSNPEAGTALSDAKSDARNSAGVQIQPTASNTGMGNLESALSSKVQDWASSKEGMNAVMQFSQNSDVKAVMGDPAVMQAIRSGDYKTLMNSPAMKKLIENSQTQALIQNVLGQKSQGPSQPGKASGEGTNAR